VAYCAVYQVVVQAVVAGVFVGVEDAIFNVHHFHDQLLHIRARHFVLAHALGFNLAATGYSTDYRGFVGSPASGVALAVRVFPVAFAGLSTPTRLKAFGRL